MTAAAWRSRVRLPIHAVACLPPVALPPRRPCGELALLRGSNGIVCIRTASPQRHSSGDGGPGSPTSYPPHAATPLTFNTHVVIVSASSDRITSADVALRFAVASGGHGKPDSAASALSAAGVLGLTSPAQDSLPPEGDAARFTCGQVSVWRVERAGLSVCLFCYRMLYVVCCMLLPVMLAAVC